MKIAILGGGQIGSVIADMLKEQGQNVYIVDPAAKSKLHYECYFYCLENEAVSNPDLIVNALPGKVGFDALTMAVKAGKNVIDVSFWDYDQNKVDELDRLAKKTGVTVLYDLGWSPGMTNILIGNALAELGDVESVDYYVGGLPQKGPYRSPYCVEDSLKFAADHTWEYSKIREPLDQALCVFERRSLPSICNPHTYRPQDFYIWVESCRHIGLFKPENLPHTTEILRNEWAVDENYRDISYMDIYVRGKDKIIEYHMVDKYDEERQMTSMAKLTATTAVLGVGLLLKQPDGFRHGLNAPEEIGFGFGWEWFNKGWKDAGITIEKLTT